MVKMDKEKSLSSEGLKDLNKEYLIDSSKQNIPSKNECVELSYIYSLPQEIVPVYELFIQKDYKELKERLKDMDVFFQGQTFYSYFDFQEYLIRHEGILMKDVLELSDDDLPFKNVLNPINTESLAQTFRHNITNIEYYKVINGNKEFSGHFVKVISKLIKEN